MLHTLPAATSGGEVSLIDGLRFAYGNQAAGLIMLLGRAIHLAGSAAGWQSAKYDPTAIENWPTDPWAFYQAEIAAKVVLELFRPQGTPTPPTPYFPPGHPRHGEEVAGSTDDGWAEQIAVQLVAGIRNSEANDYWDELWMQSIRPLFVRFGDNLNIPEKPKK